MRYGYENAAGNRISGMMNRGGPGRSGGTSEGGGILSLLANAQTAQQGPPLPGPPAPPPPGFSPDQLGGMSPPSGFSLDQLGGMSPPSMQGMSPPPGFSLDQLEGMSPLQGQLYMDLLRR